MLYLLFLYILQLMRFILLYERTRSVTNSLFCTVSLSIDHAMKSWMILFFGHLAFIFWPFYYYFEKTLTELGFSKKFSSFKCFICQRISLMQRYLWCIDQFFNTPKRVFCFYDTMFYFVLRELIMKIGNFCNVINLRTILWSTSLQTISLYCWIGIFAF